MKLLELHMDGFGKFHDRTISFEDGLNIIYGKNEAGKSTLHTFIRSMLFGLERGRGRAAKNDLYSKYEPWENSGTYEGWLRLEKDGMIYRIERRFRKENKTFKIINETLGREEDITKVFLDQLLGGLTETTYNNTISIGQLKSATEEGMVGELRNYIANINTTGNISLNITKATTFLRNQKRILEANLVPDASREYTALLAEIRNVEEEIAAPQYENQLSAYQAMRTQVKNVIQTTQFEKNELVFKIERARKVIREAGFTDGTSIIFCQDHADNCYQNYCSAEHECKKKSRTVFMILSFILALGLAAGTAYLNMLDPLNSFPLIVGGAAASVILLILAIFLNRKRKYWNRTLEENRSKLTSLLTAHLGDGTISAEAINAFHDRLDEFLNLCDTISRSEIELRKFSDDIASLQEKQNNCSEMIEQQQRIQWELEKKLEHLSNCKNRAVNLKRILAENDRISDEITAIELAQETMTDLSSSIRDSFGLYLNKEASRLVNGITGGIYDSMSIDENLNVFLNTKRKLVPIESVSSGTMDQVYLAVRLAAARLLQGDGEPFPLIFDDSFTQYDDERLRTALKWLDKTYGGQMLIFTCHKREMQMLDAHQIEYHSVEI